MVENTYYAHKQSKEDECAIDGSLNASFASYPSHFLFDIP